MYVITNPCRLIAVVECVADCCGLPSSLSTHFYNCRQRRHSSSTVTTVTMVSRPVAWLACACSTHTQACRGRGDGGREDVLAVLQSLCLLSHPCRGRGVHNLFTACQGAKDKGGQAEGCHGKQPRPQEGTTTNEQHRCTESVASLYESKTQSM